MRPAVGRKAQPPSRSGCPGIVWRWIVLVGLALPVPAHAYECDDVASWTTGPAPGAVVPPDPTIYVFVPPRSRFVVEQEPRSEWFRAVLVDGRPVEYHAEIVARSEAWDVVELVVLARTGELAVDLPFTGRASFRIGTPPPDRARVTDVTLLRDDYDRGFEIEATGSAAAYRIHWVGGGTDVLPAADTVFLGTRYCSGADVDRRMLEGNDPPRGFVLDALFADGSARRLGGAKVLLEPDASRAPRELVGAEVRAPAWSQPAASRPLAAPRAPQPPVPALPIALLALTVLAAGVLVLAIADC